jgi:hypothetical protein
MLNKTQYELTYTKCIGAAIDAIWQMLNPIHNSWTGFKGLENEDFLKRREAFLWVLERLLKEGRIKLHKNGVFLESSIEEQIETFRHAFPKNIKDADKMCTKPGYEVPYEDFGMNVWWFMDSCPAGIAWRREDGSYEIAD